MSVMHRVQMKNHDRRHWEMEQQALEEHQTEDGGATFAMVGSL